MRTLTRNETADFLTGSDRFAILTHRRPDGDTLGSSALLCRGLRSLGKTAHILVNPEITEKDFSGQIDGHTIFFYGTCDQCLN